MKIKINRPILIEATLQEFATDEVRSMIGEKEYQRVKARDPHPLFVKLDVGRQGESRGNAMVQGIKMKVRKIWSRTRIKEMAKWLNKRIPLYIGHSAMNEKSGRSKIGETIKGWCEEMSDGLHALAVAWIPSANAQTQEMVRKKELDICSIEAGFLFSLGKIGKMFVDKITELTAIALGSRKSGMVPGFATAGVVAQVQEMSSVKEVIDEALREKGFDPDDIDIVVEDNDDDEDDKNKKKQKVNVTRKARRKKLEDLTLGEVQVWTKNQKIMPTQLFSLEELLNVKAVSEAMEAEVNERIEGVEAEKGGEISGLQDKVTNLESEKKALEDKRKELEDALKEKDNKITEQEKEFSPYRDQQRRQKLEDMVRNSDKLKDIPKEQVDFIAAHVSVAGDVDLSSDKAGDVIEAAIDKQMDDIKKFGLKIDGKDKEEDDEDDGKNKGEYINPLIPRSDKK